MRKLVNHFREHDPPKYQMGAAVNVHELPEGLAFPLSGRSRILFVRKCYERITSICDDELAANWEFGRRGAIFTGALGNGKVIHRFTL